MGGIETSGSFGHSVCAGVFILITIIYIYIHFIYMYRKYSTSDKLVYLATDCVDQTIDTIIEREGFGKPFIPFDYICNMFMDILTASAFGKRLDKMHIIFENYFQLNYKYICKIYLYLKYILDMILKTKSSYI